MRVLLCIDDTDNIDSRGTGDLAELIAKEIEEKGWGRTYGITRHQLFVHPDVPYTSHNSSMCFTADIQEQTLGCLIAYASQFLFRESAAGSDPGLCVALPDRIPDANVLVSFGKKAKTALVTKDEAYQLAASLGIHLSEHGGTGQGVIGALAGVGLRLSGNDGRFKGKFKIDSIDGLARVDDILSLDNVDLVQSLDGQILDASERVWVGHEAKTVFLKHRSVLLVCPWDGAAKENIRWQLCSKQQVKKF
jgi:hypothetical protein